MYSKSRTFLFYKVNFFRPEDKNKKKIFKKIFESGVYIRSNLLYIIIEIKNSGIQDDPNFYNEIYEIS